MKNQEQEKQPEMLSSEWGSQLVSAREQLGISIEQVAAELNLPKEYIVALETGDLEGLPSIVFARGYIRTYSKLLNLDDNQLVSDFEHIHGQGAVNKKQIRSISTVRDQVKINDPVMKFSTWVFVFVIIGLSVWWWQAQDGGGLSIKETLLGGDSQSTVAPTVESQSGNGSSTLALPKLVDAPLDEKAVSVDTPSEDESAELKSDEAESEPVYLSESDIKKLQASVDDKSVSAETEVAPVKVEPSLTEARIEADFVAECWVTVKDANGKTLFNNLRGKGQSINVVGKPPLSVLIGATSAVGGFSFNGASVDLQKYSSKNIVRMSLPSAE